MLSLEIAANGEVVRRLIAVNVYCADESQNMAIYSVREYSRFENGWKNTPGKEFMLQHNRNDGLEKLAELMLQAWRKVKP